MNVSTFQPSGVREVNKHLDALELRAEFQGHTADTNWPVGQFATRLPDGVLYAFNSEEKFDAYVTLFKQDADAAHASIGWEVSFPEETSPDIHETTQSTPEPFLGVFVTNESSEGI